EDGEERERAEPRLERAADDEAPGAAGQVVQEHDRQTAEPDPEPEEVRDEVGAKELGRIGERAERAGDERDDPDDERRRPHRAAPSSFARSAGGTSASVPCWLRCSART